MNKNGRMAEEKLIKTSFDIAEDKLDRFKIALIKKKISMRDFIHDKIDEFILQVETEEKKKEDE